VLLSPRSDSLTDSKQQRATPTKSLLNRAIALLARRDHSRAELYRKLLPHVREEDELGEIDRVLDELDRKGLLSDERFASAIVRNRSQRFGDARIRYDLRKFGVADDVSAAALSALSKTEVSRADAVRSKRFSALPVSAAERSKQARFLQSRGFSLDSIYRVLRGRAEGE
jgi:regulatory protein